VRILYTKSGGDLTQEELKQLLRYDPHTGWFIKTNVPLGSITKNGYLTICIKYKKYYLHRLAFLYMTGTFPPNDVDHKNGNRLDNSWCNLREATRSQNLQNRKANLNRELPKNVYKTKSGKYRVMIKFKSSVKHYGYFHSLDAATEVAKQASKDLFGEYAK